MGKTSFFAFALVVAFRTCKPRKRKRKYKGKVKAQVPSAPFQHSSAKRKHLHCLCVGRVNAVCTYTCSYPWICARRWDTPYNGLYGEALSERGTFFRLQVYERVGILLIAVYERIGKSVNWVLERAQRANRWILWLYKFEKTFYFGDWFLFKLQGIFSSCKGCEVLNKVCERGPICQYLSWQMVCKGVRGWTLGQRLPYKALLGTPLGFRGIAIQ